MFIALLIFSRASVADLNTISIATQTLTAIPSCLHYQVIGICFWEKKGIVSSTLKVKHYIPDVVVTIYNYAKGTSTNPWMEARIFYDLPAFTAGNTINKKLTGYSLGGGQASRGDQHNDDSHCKEVDVIGNPIVDSFFGNDIFLPSQATPFKPYFQSQLDVASWRSPLLEMITVPQGNIPGLHEIGRWPLSSWGPVYPRSGFIAHPNDAKSAAITAFRAAHIVTRTGQSHVYQPISDSTSCGIECTTESVTENDDRIQWQMLSPIVSKKCESFGQSDLTQIQEWGSDASQKANGSYAFNLWRLYSGCLPGDGVYIGSINF